MDRRRTQRILGILVIIALVIILFPLFFGKNDTPTQASNIAPPPFPDQQQAQTSVAETNSATNTAVPTESQAIPQQPADTFPTQADAAGAANQNEMPPMDANPATNPAESANAAHPADATNPAEAASTMAPSAAQISNEQSEVEFTPAVVTDSKQTSPHEQARAVKIVNEKNEVISPDSAQAKTVGHDIISAVDDKAIKSISLNKHKNSVAKVKATPSVESKLTQLNSKAWAIQMGSFVSKDNARVLADKLRVAGFKAFTKEVKSAQGTVQTRVYIGPEFKQASAVKLSQDVAKATNLQGIVVAYKPLAL